MNVVFVCTGNTCRSPMAEGLFRSILKDKNISDVQCGSCGVGAFTGFPASEYAIETMKQFGVDISDHRSRPVSRYILDEGDLFVCMTNSHLNALSPYVPKEKLCLLSEDGIPDPYMGSQEDYLHCAEKIYKSLVELIEKTGVGSYE